LVRKVRTKSQQAHTKYPDDTGNPAYDSECGITRAPTMMGQWYRSLRRWKIATRKKTPPETIRYNLLLIGPPGVSRVGHTSGV
jgi:hypothetical protein